MIVSIGTLLITTVCIVITITVLNFSLYFQLRSEARYYFEWTPVTVSMRRNITLLIVRPVSSKELPNIANDLTNVRSRSIVLQRTNEMLFVGVKWYLFVFDPTFRNKTESVFRSFNQNGTIFRVIFENGWAKHEFWQKYLVEAVVKQFDYIWLVDGDVSLTSIDWDLYWNLVDVFNPQIAQPSLENGQLIDGFLAEGNGRASEYSVLNRKGKPDNVVAAETVIVEVGAPMLTVQSWIAFHRIMNETYDYTKEKSSDWGIDFVWCKLVKDLVLNQTISAPTFTENSEETIKDFGQSLIDGDTPACLVLYATPAFHLDQRTMDKGTKEFRRHPAMAMWKKKYPQYFSPQHPTSPQHAIYRYFISVNDSFLGVNISNAVV